MKLTKGKKYDLKNLIYTGMNQDAEGVNCSDYFDRDGTYLGPDEFGTEPTFDAPDLMETTMKITDAKTNTTTRVCRTYRTTDRQALLHVTDDRRVWLDTADGANMTHVGTLGDRGSDTVMTAKNARRAANQ